MSENITQAYYKKPYPECKPEKEGEYHTNYDDKYWDGIHWRINKNSSSHNGNIQWFFEPAPEVKGAKEFLKEKGISIDEEIDTKASSTQYDIAPYKLVDLLTEFAQLQKPVSEEYHYNTKVVKGKNLEIFDRIWHGNNFYSIKELLPLEIVFATFRIGLNYKNMDFLVQISPEHKEQ